MTRRWVRYETPVMVCVDVDDDTQHAEITNVVLVTSEQDILLARDHRGHFLVYDERGEPLNHDVAGGGDRAAAQAIRTAEDRDAWPATADWDEGPDPVRYPELYDDTDQAVSTTPTGNRSTSMSVRCRKTNPFPTAKAPSARRRRSLSLFAHCRATEG